ncbi:hypothetical protein GCM10009623_34340 [Nocardioides aestuarii]
MGVPARDDRDTVVARIVERLPDRVARALGGDREALIGLLLIAADVGWQSRAEILGTVEEVADAAQQFADSVADCYSSQQPPSDRLCDVGFALAYRVDALAIEVLHRRAGAGTLGSAAPVPPIGQLALEVRHTARAHVAALRDAATAGHVPNRHDVEAAEHLYGSVVRLTRAALQRDIRATLGSLEAPPEPHRD